MGVENKLDAIDLVINILIEHEKKLDSIVERLETYTQSIEHIIKKETLYNISHVEKQP
jgi:hypothetical protein